MNSPVEVNRGVVMCSVRNIFASEPSDGKISRVSELTGFLEVVVENANLAKMVATNNFAVCKNQTVENVLVEYAADCPFHYPKLNRRDRPGSSTFRNGHRQLLLCYLQTLRLELHLKSENVAKLRAKPENAAIKAPRNKFRQPSVVFGNQLLRCILSCGFNNFRRKTPHPRRRIQLQNRHVSLSGVDKNIPVGLIHVDDRTNLDATGGRGDLELLHHDEPAVPAKNHQLACLIQHNEPFLVESRRLYMANCHDPVGRGRKGVSGDAGVSTSGNVNFSITSSCLNGCRGAGLVTAGVNGAASAGLKVNFGFSAGFEDGSGWGAGVGLKRGAGAGAGVGLKRDTAGAGFAGGATGGFSTDLIVSTGFT